MYGDDASSQANSMLLTTLLAEALANSSSSAAAASSSSSLTTSNPSTLAQTTNAQMMAAQNALFQQANAFQQNQLLLPTQPLTLPTTTLVAPAPTPAAQLLFNTAASSTIPNLDAANQLLMQSAALNQMLLLNSALQQDIMRLSQDTHTFHLNDDNGSESSRSTTAAPPMINTSGFGTAFGMIDKPLDLTTRKLSTHLEQPCTSSTPRPSVIKNSFPPKPPRLEPSSRSCGVKRSTSSLSYRSAPDPDVCDHFRRSLSGKWPRRPANYSHYTTTNRLDSTITPGSWQSSVASTTVTSPTTPRRQFLGSNSCVSQMVIGEGEVEEHFRRTFELIRQQSADSKAKESPSPNATTSTRL